MYASTCRLIVPRFLRLHADLGSEPMSTALRAHFREWDVFTKAQSMKFDAQPQPQLTSGTSSVTADKRYRNAMSKPPQVRIPSTPESADARDHGNFDTSPEDYLYERDEVVESVTVPSLKESLKANTNANGDVDSAFDYPKTPDSLAPTDSVGASAGPHSPASDSNSRNADNGIASPSESPDSSAATKVGGSEIGGLQGAGEVGSTTRDSDDDFLGDFCPHLLHEPHRPVPIAMVNRRPTGSEPFRPTADVPHAN